MLRVHNSLKWLCALSSYLVLKKFSDMAASNASCSGEEHLGDTQCPGKSVESVDPSVTSLMSEVTPLELTKPLFENGRFKNPWSKWHDIRILDALKFEFMEKNNSKVPKTEELDKTLPILKPDLKQFEQAPVSGIRSMWVGHATVLVQVGGITILTDPVFSARCSPSQYFGPKRYRDPPCTVEDLPKIDAVVISHNHYDHLDYTSVVALNRKYGNNLRWYVPMGLKKWMLDQGCENVVELSWWDEDEFPNKKDVKFACTPCQHWCKRNLALDDNKVLWCSWAIIGPNHSFYFGGDTGYCEGFKQIGNKYGPFTFAAIPIGAYEPRWFMEPQHVSPKEAVDIHLDVKSQHSLGIHWGTFKLSYEPYMEPKEMLFSEIQRRKLKPDTFFTMSHGEIRIIGGDNYQEMD